MRAAAKHRSSIDSFVLEDVLLLEAGSNSSVVAMLSAMAAESSPLRLSLAKSSMPFVKCVLFGVSSTSDSLSNDLNGR